MPEIDLAGLPVKDIDLSGLPVKKKTPESLGGLLEERAIEATAEPNKEAQLLGLFGEMLKLPQEILGAGIPSKKETFLEKLTRRKLPGEELASNVSLTIPGFGSVSPGLQKESINLVADPLWLIPGGGQRSGAKLAGRFADDFTKALESATKSLAAEITPYTKTALNQKFLRALKTVKPLRETQEAIYTKERGERIAKVIAVGKKTYGEKGFYAQKAQLKGEMKKVDFTSLKEKMPQQDVDRLFEQVKYSREMSEFEKVHAGDGLAKMFGEGGGKVPQRSQIALLEREFGKELTDELMKKRTLFQKVKDAGYELFNIPRSIMASFDLSFGFRQGIFTMTRHPVIFFKNFAKQFKLFGSEKYYQKLLEEIHSRPTYDLMRKHGLSFTELGNLTKREEAFMSNWAEKIPFGVGRMVRASGRAYTGFADRLRADLFDYMIKYGEKSGKLEAKYLDDAAKFVNAATGRGHLPFGLEKGAVFLNTTFFSPRLLASRLHLVNPYFYYKLHPMARKEALKSLFSFAGMGLTVSGLAKMAGAEIETDSRNANFAKVKTGNTRFDVLGGFQQPIRAAAQMISGQIISSTTGKVMTLGEGYKPLTPVDIAQRFLEMKFAPIPSFAIALMRGQTAIGEKMDVPTEIANRFVPMVIQDTYDLYKEGGLNDVPMAAPAIFGVGVQTYGGVQSWGLRGTDYRSLNKELTRLKTSMGFPSSSAFGYEFDLKEYKRFKDAAGNRIAKDLTKLIHTSQYKKLADWQKKKIIEDRVDDIKQQVKHQLYPDRYQKSLIRSQLRWMGIEENKIEDETVKLLKEK